MTDTLKLEGVGLDVRDGSSLRTLLEIDEFCLEPGEMIAVRGASGAGKTTFLKLVSGILLPTRGRVLYGDTEVSALSEPRRDRWRGRHVGFLFQDFRLFDGLTALENVLLPFTFCSRTVSNTQRSARAPYPTPSVATRRTSSSCTESIPTRAPNSSREARCSARRSCAC